MTRTPRVLTAMTAAALLATGCTGTDDGASVRTIDEGSASSASASSASGLGTDTPSEGLGGFEPVSDVASHAMVVLDVCDINELLPTDADIDFDAVAAIYTDGANSESGDGMRTLQSNAAAERDEPLWDLYEARLGTAWLDAFVTAALEGTGVFEGEDQLVRRQAVQKGVKDGVMVAWAFHELDAARAKVVDGDIDPAEGAPHNVDEIWAFQHGDDPSCAPVSTAFGRGEDFGTGTAAYDRALAAVQALQAAAVAGDVDAYDVAYDEYVTATALPYVQATIKYAANVSSDLAADDAAAARIHQAEGWAFFRVIEPLVADVDAGAADAIVGVLDLANQPSVDAGQVVAEAMASVYEGLGLTAEDVGTYEG